MNLSESWFLCVVLPSLLVYVCMALTSINGKLSTVVEHLAKSKEEK